ncbi:hypothetical protein O3M35_009812 [Rhynocoris fuscipes]|uniref:Uncharacterized protein n=1 Tax=Rhynocoris fuscipes TaxID=488301 RepID=A0AAW1DBC6_9HEMI
MELMDSSLTTDQEIREEIETFMFAGHDTISTASTFALYELGRNPDIQEKLYAEMQTIFGDSDRDPTRKDLNEMHYLDNVIKETLRLYPSVPYISRKLLQDLELKDGTVIPRGANCAMVPYFLHRHPKYFPNPEVFDPARFNYDNSRKRHPFVYIPFSAGPRNCIGQKYAVLEMKVILSTIIRFAQIETVTKPEDFTVLPLLILRTSSPIKVKITPRNKFIC